MSLVLYHRLQPYIIEGRSPTDRELEAEGNVLGCMMSDNAVGLEDHEVNDHMVPLTFLSFGNPFHAAAYYAALALELTIGACFPNLVWTLVEHHPDAKCFGLIHLEQLAQQASPDNLRDDIEVLSARAVRLLARERALSAHGGTTH